MDRTFEGSPQPRQTPVETSPLAAPSLPPPSQDLGDDTHDGIVIDAVASERRERRSSEPAIRIDVTDHFRNDDAIVRCSVTGGNAETAPVRETMITTRCPRRVSLLPKRAQERLAHSALRPNIPAISAGVPCDGAQHGDGADIVVHALPRKSGDGVSSASLGDFINEPQ